MTAQNLPCVLINRLHRDEFLLTRGYPHLIRGKCWYFTPSNLETSFVVISVVVMSDERKMRLRESVTCLYQSPASSIGSVVRAGKSHP